MPRLFDEDCPPLKSKLVVLLDLNHECALDYNTNDMTFLPTKAAHHEACLATWLFELVRWNFSNLHVPICQ